MDIRDGTRADWTRAQLFRCSLIDSSQRFKWILFIAIVGSQKCLRLYPMSHTSTTDTSLFNIIQQAMHSYSKFLFDPSSVIDWLPHLTGYLDHPRQLIQSSVMFVFSPYVYSDVVQPVTSSATATAPLTAAVPASHNVYLSLHNVWSKVVSTLNTTAIDSTTHTLPHESHASSGLDMLTQHCKTGLVDAFDGLSIWLTSYLYNVLTILVILVLIDYVKHATIALYNKSITSDTYRSFCKQVSNAYVTAEPVGIDDSKDTFTASHFDFLAMPLAVIVLRELWHLTLALVNSCMFGRLTWYLFGVNLVISPSSVARCKYYAEVSLPAETTAWHTTAHSIEPTRVLMYSVAALLALRLAVFLCFCSAKIFTRLCIRAIALSYVHPYAVAGSNATAEASDLNSITQHRTTIHDTGNDPTNVLQLIKSAFQSPMMVKVARRSEVN